MDGYPAENLIKTIAPIIGGSGVGQHDTVQVGAPDMASLDRALQKFASRS
jgi:alanyl-tRNA synthetase